MAICTCLSVGLLDILLFIFCCFIFLSLFLALQFSCFMIFMLFTIFVELVLSFVMLGAVRVDIKQNFLDA